MRILVCVLLLLLLLPGLVSTQEKDKWERVYTLEDATIAMNATTVEFSDNGFGLVQFRWNFGKPQSLDGSSETKYKTRVETIEFNCDRRRYRLAAFTLFDTKGKPVFSKKLEDSEKEWKFLKAGGMMERLFGPACKVIEEKRP
ncbi:MAG TPA: surface-adhesin E family protein [Pyrinomonadaceae bacterium]|jgi:hypothetical protein